jgi:recombination associated protein RdgC
MHFRNLVIYRLPEFKLTAGQLEDFLTLRQLAPVTGLSTVSRGFVPPQESSGLVYSSGRQMLISLGVLTKKLPASAVKEAVKAKVAQLETAQGFKPGKKQTREIREQIISEMLPKIPATYRTTRALLDPANGWIVVDTPSVGRAEELTEQLRNTLGTLCLTLPNTKLSPSTVMTTWLSTGGGNPSFGIGNDCEIRGTSAEKDTIKYSRCDLETEDVRRTLKDGGKTVRKLALYWNTRVSFVLTDTMQVKRFAYTDLVRNVDSQAAPETAELQFEADFILFASTLASVIPALIAAHGGYEE